MAKTKSVAKGTVAKATGAPAPVQAPAATPAVVAKVVALRGGQAVAQVKLTAKAYRVTAVHNKAWFDLIGKQCAGDKPAGVADLIKLGVPSHFIGYGIRRGYLAAA